MAIVELRYDVKPVSFVADNPTLVLADGEPIFLENGSYAFGDGSTQLSGLTFFSPGTQTTRVLSGGTITVDDISGSPGDNDVVVSATSYFISGQGTFSAEETTFIDIVLSSSGTQRYVGFFGDVNGDIIKSEGTEAAVASYPSTPANHCPIGYVLVSDGSVGSAEEPGSVNFSDIGGNASDNASLVSLVYDPRLSSVASTATVTMDCSLKRQYETYNLATNVTIAAPLNPVDGFLLLWVYRDNGVTRTITRNPIFTDLTGNAPTSTTANKVGMELYRYSSARSRWEIITCQTQP